MNQNIRNLTDKAILAVEVMEVVQWHPLEDGQGPPTQVHILITATNAPYPLAIRIKSREACTSLVAALVEHMDEVWPANQQILPPIAG